MSQSRHATTNHTNPDLRLHIPLDQRDDLSGDDAVQGELFSGTVEDERPARGYRGTVASKAAGITYRQLDYWARKRPEAKRLVDNLESVLVSATCHGADAVRRARGREGR